MQISAYELKGGETRGRPLVGVGSGALVLAASIPFVFLHVRYQPSIHLRIRSAEAGIELSDLAIALVGLVALWEGRRLGFAPLRAGVWLWGSAGLLLVWIAARSQSVSHAITAAKFAEYAVLALACPLVLRRGTDWRAVAVAVSAWSAAATAVGLLQFFGVKIAGAWPVGWRQPSFLGPSDFAALSVLALGVGLAALVFGDRPSGWLPLVVGDLGVILSGASAAVVGILAAAAALLWLAWRRAVLTRKGFVVTAIAVAVAAIGVSTIRAHDFSQFAHFFRAKHTQRSTGVQTYVQHTLLLYAGYRIWLAHPVLGVGWRQTSDAATMNPVLPALRRRFPNVAPLAFPTAAHEWGVQDAYVQAAADLGAVGFLLWLAPFVAAVFLAARAKVPPGAVALFAVLAAMGLWAAQGLVAGIPLDALTWLGFGFAAAAAARTAARESD